MNTVTSRTWRPGSGGILCLPMQQNIKDAAKHPDWRPVRCPKCGRGCWESDLARQAMAAGAAAAYCTECAIRAGMEAKEAGKA